MPERLGRDERIARLEAEFARLLLDAPGTRHIHARTDFAITYFEVQGGTDREFSTCVIDEFGKFHSKSSTLR